MTSVRECHGCGARTTAGRCDECNARPWTDEPFPPDTDPMVVAAELRSIADRIEVREVERPKVRTDGGMRNGRSDEGTNVPGQHQPVDPMTRGYIHVLAAVGLRQKSIAEAVDLSSETIDNHLTRTAERVREGEDPIEVFEGLIDPLFETEPPEGGDA